MDALEDSGELDSTLVVLTADHGSVAAARRPLPRRLRGGERLRVLQLVLRRPAERRPVLQPAAGLPLQATDDTGNVGLSYSDSSLNVWLKNQSPEKVGEAAAIMEDLPDVTAVWRRNGDHFDRVSPIRWDRMHSGAERSWFDRKAQELVDTQAADYGPDLIATLPDNTTYSVLGRPRRHPAGLAADPDRLRRRRPVARKDLRAEVKSVDIMPTILQAMGITPTYDMDGTAYALPRAKR